MPSARIRSAVAATPRASQVSNGPSSWPKPQRTASSIDDAVRWGFGHELGPFETWDALGVAATAERMRAEGIALPAWIDQMLASGHPTFYRTDDRDRKSPYDPRAGACRS